ncbi:ABC transporter [Ceratobasidium sp. AG-Ba]|nr:ABC transporter [Ceratobasidium sp. AG-Ba]QRV91390.1 ABC transporter [Ceratobasidium sp. AG-Ba]QRW05452.1 ABC transporter [Ceratobasidium sp. AG-Ba]
MSSTGENAINVKELTYSHSSYANNTIPALDNLSLNLPKGSRTLLIGANGAGKSTLLQILAGKRLVKGKDVRIFGRDVFRDSPPGVTFLGTEWAMNPVVRSDIVVSHFLDSVGGYRHKARRDRLLDILDVDLDWHMHAISDGERRRVQLVMGLMAEWDLLLLDEVTVDLDVLVRDDLLTFLKEESENRGATILYATHIFDGLNNFPTHVAHMRFGSFVVEPAHWSNDQTQVETSSSAPGSTLHALALQWLKEDRTYRRQEEANGRFKKTRGPKEDTGVPTDSEAFYKKYDYSH